MGLVKYFVLATFFAIATAYYLPSLDFTNWPSAAMLNGRDAAFIMGKFNYLSQARRQIPPPAQLLRVMITQNRYVAETVTVYDAVYYATEGSTCVGKITVTKKEYCGQGVVCTSGMQSAQCYPPGYPGLRV